MLLLLKIILFLANALLHLVYLIFNHLLSFQDTLFDDV